MCSQACGNSAAAVTAALLRYYKYYLLPHLPAAVACRKPLVGLTLQLQLQPNTNRQPGSSSSGSSSKQQSQTAAAAGRLTALLAPAQLLLLLLLL
jgi:hypothetical protein